MSFKILYVSATIAESEALRKVRSIVIRNNKHYYGRSEIDLVVGGVGSMSTAWAMKQWLSVNEKPDLAINAGIAGSYKDEYPVGDVLMPVSDCFADAGVEDGDKFMTLHEAGLTNKDEFPFRNGIINAENNYCELMRIILKPVDAITVNMATGSDTTRQRLIEKYDPDIETMEGAAFFYICTMENIPFIALRSVSNKVEIRNTYKWNIPVALENLAIKLDEVFKILGR